ncbi:response regulator [Chryseobacterium shandongense]|uniref:Response regulator n=1 Tax=Chryseobacterium shandongense TaxID=1493872 RepID=A0AAD0YAB2_9FLAO|nr:response regulator [Chryseobacterium shandongense]AZA97672.1 response regulator [Chryseobacterium shandongense]
MSLPIIFCLDDDEQVLRAITRDLKSQYRDRYRILSTTSVTEALESLLELQNKGDAIALLLTDQRMPDLLGVEFLSKAMKYFPDAKRALLTAYADKDAAIKAINEVKLDYYLVKPWDPPEEKLFPVIDDLLYEWQCDYHPIFKGIRVVGFQYSQRSHEIKDFLAGNLVPYHWIDIEIDKEAKKQLVNNGLFEDDLPVVFLEDGSYLKQPSLAELAYSIGLNPQIKHNDIYDVVIIGAGPAGLAASVYGASEGLKTLLIERRAPGGQAGTSSRIENYLGFPTGLSGAELTRRAMTQAMRLGTEFLSPRSVHSIQQQDGYKRIVLDGEEEIISRSVIITTGVDYRKLDTEGIEDFTGAGIYYGAAMTEATACTDKEVYVVGGGNSAGQAAMYLSKFARNVYILIRKDDLTSTMSTYLISQIAAQGNINVRGNMEIVKAYGSDKLERLMIRSLQTGSIDEVPANALYIFIGAKPFTDWIELGIIKDDKGFLQTGRELKLNSEYARIWKQKRDPYLLETSSPGIFAAGDVRAGAMNRVASAVGEGSMAISFVHKYLAEVK